MTAVVAQGRLLDLVEQRIKSQCAPVNIRLWNGASSGATGNAVTLTVKSPGALARTRQARWASSRCYVSEIDLEGSVRDVIPCRRAWSPTRTRSRLPTLGWWWRSRKADRRSIRSHYDVGNDFYEQWLDRNRVYSYACFKSFDDTLWTWLRSGSITSAASCFSSLATACSTSVCGWGGPGPCATTALRSGSRCPVTRVRHAANPGTGPSGPMRASCSITGTCLRDVPFDKISSVGMFGCVGGRNLRRTSPRSTGCSSPVAWS